MSSENKILLYVKQGLGMSSSLNELDDVTDNELIPIIDGCLSDLSQQSVGTNARLFQDKDLTWDTFFNNTSRDRGDAMLYVVLKVRVLFDPPLPATLSAMTKSYEEAIWRARTEFDRVVLK